MYANYNQPLDEQIISDFGSRAQAIWLEIMCTEHEAKGYELRTATTWLCYYSLGYCLQVAEHFLQDDLSNLPEDSRDRETLVAMVDKIREIIQRRRDMKGIR
ncbi:hypothetical protein [Synechococcus elongatus]|uniref:hypothetical protein n=1 Tax=Synechococcus elongatus TaxID=32046 RepID=UPI0030CD2F11